MEMLTDNPISAPMDDQFGARPYAQILADTIVETNSLPFCIGIYGEWGTGKSSLMNMTRFMLKDRPDVRTLAFNPWKYDKKEELWSALIRSILFAISEGNQGELGKRAKKLAVATAWLLLKKSVSHVSAGIVTEDNLDKLADTVTKQDEVFYRHINRFEDDFQAVVDEFTNYGKLVIFIDDLDRCLPENAITVLESLKLFIGNARCVFVLGMDHYVIEEGINLRFGSKIKMSGRDYLDKIIQVPFYLPPIPFSKLRNAFRTPATQDYSDAFWRLTELGLRGNPRKTKRFVNCFYLLKKIMLTPETAADLAEGDPDEVLQLSALTQDYLLGKLLVLQMSYPDFYSFLRLHPDAWEYYEKRLVGAAGLDGRSKALQDQPALEPFWNDESLRSFLTESSPIGDKGLPGAPAEEIVKRLMRAISLVGESGSRPESRAKESARRQQTPKVRKAMR